MQHSILTATTMLAAFTATLLAHPTRSLAETTPISPEATAAASAFHIPEGFTLTPVASEPLLQNPVAFCFDPQGRIFVAETHRVHGGVEDNRNHMDWVDDDLAARTVEDRRAYITRHVGKQITRYTQHSELVRLLEDRDRDGLYEHASVFSTGYNDVVDGAAAGVMWIGDRLLFTCIPSVWELRDADGDGVAEHKQALASGFGVHFALFGHDLHGLTHGPDGKVYFSIGDRGLHVTTAEGRALSNPDSGAVLRCNPDGSELELFAAGLRNPQELAFNEFGDLFTVDNNSDSGDRARLVHIIEGMDAGWRMSYQYLPDRGPFNREKVWHVQNDEQSASILPPLAHISDGPSGLVRYPGTGMPAEHEGSFFLADFKGAAPTSGIRQFWIEPAGATYRLARERMFVEGILATDCEFGPDGALYISDWIHGWGGTGKGRIHRVASDDAASKTERERTQQLLAEVDGKEVAELLQLLSHADMRVRLAAQRKLVARRDVSIHNLLQVASTDGGHAIARLHAVWALGELAESSPGLFDKLASLASDADPEVRAQVARTLGRAASSDEAVRQRIGERVTPLLADESARVRSLAAISLGNLRYEPALKGLLAMCRENADRDATLRHAAVMGLAGSQRSETLLAASRSAGESERLAITIALGRHKSQLVANMLADNDGRVRREAARMIWDTPLPTAYEALAKALKSASPTDEPLVRRALAASVAMRSPECLESVIAFGLQHDLPRHMQDHLWQLVRRWADPAPREPVHGLWRPLEAGSSAEIAAALRTVLPRLIEGGDRGAQGVVVAAELGVSEAIEPAAAIAAADKYLPELRARAMAALASADEQLVRTAIDAGTHSPEPVLRSAARQLLLTRFPTEAVALLVEAAESASTREQQAAIAMLAQLDESAAQSAIGKWLARLEQGDCPPELRLDVLEAALQAKDPSLVERATHYRDQLATKEAHEQFAASLHGGNADEGRRIFHENAALACRRCHSVDPGVKLVGPSLADVGERLKRSELLESIVRPNEKIAEGFQTTVLQLDTGKAVSGILRSEDDKTAVLVDAEGDEIVVDAATIEDRFEGLSAMPEDLAKQMTARELRDLVEFLSQQRNTATSAHGAGGE